MTTSGTIDLFFNDYNEHNLTIYFGGETYEYLFNSSISETIALACKSLEATVIWKDINVTIEGMSVILQYYDGTSWIDIQEAISDTNGLVSFTGLVMGDYRLNNTEFNLNQSTITYITDVFIEADLTIIDVDYLNTIFGANYPVDLSTITWEIQIYMPVSGIWTGANSGHYDGIIIDNVAGTITIYNLVDGYDYRFILFDYAGVNTTYDIIFDGSTQIDLDAKSLDAEFLWSFDNTSVVGMDFTLFKFDGVEWISVGIYTTDINGKVIISGVLPCGTYKFNDMAEFSIIASDITKTITSMVESLCVEEKSFSLGFYNGTIESKYFLFCIK